ncbi:MAG: hypothetical protein J5691_00810 [Bacilli bacterium]|nr:hypothetical protein [Bacilli bacterium]
MANTDIVNMTKAVIGGLMAKSVEKMMLKTSFASFPKFPAMPTIPDEVFLHPDGWYVINANKKKLGANYRDYIGVKFIYPKYTLDTYSGFPSDQILSEHKWNQKGINGFINELTKGYCNIEKKLHYKQGDKRLIYEFFMKKEDVAKVFALFKIQGTVN